MKQNNPISFEVPWSLLTLVKHPSEPGVYESGFLREDIGQWLDEHAGPYGWTLEAGFFCTYAHRQSDRPFRITIKCQRVAILFQLAWSEDMRMPRVGEPYEVNIYRF